MCSELWNVNYSEDLIRNSIFEMKLKGFELLIFTIIKGFAYIFYSFSVAVDPRKPGDWPLFLVCVKGFLVNLEMFVVSLILLWSLPRS